MRWIVVHGADGRAHLPVRQGEEPPDAAFHSFRQVQPQILNQQHVGKVLSDQDAARLWLAQLLHHLLETPTQGSLVGLFADMDDRRQDT
jgi:hypothetical protein